MMHHWDRIGNEEEMLCCAQLFVNIEFLGCRYAPEVMQKIKLMSAEVPQIRKYRESRKDNLKRTFVTAKDAVQAKYKKINENEVLPIKIIKVEMNNEQLTDDKAEWQTYIKETALNLNIKSVSNSPSILLSEAQKLMNLRSLLRDVIVFENCDEEDFNYSLNKTTACMKKIGKLDTQFDDECTKFFYIFNDQIIAEGKSDSKKSAKKVADEEFLRVLKENCYTIRNKLKYFSGEEIIKKRNESKTVSQKNNQIQEDNLGFKLLSKLGWKGGSLGLNGSGIIDPINLEIKIGKQGLGSEMRNFDKKYFRSLLYNFKQNQVEYDLIFSSEFSKEERAQIHQ